MRPLWRLAAILVALVGIGAALTSITVGLSAAGRDLGRPLVVWGAIAIVWAWIVGRAAASSPRLWYTPSALFTSGLVAGAIVAIAARLPALRAELLAGASRSPVLGALDALFYELGIIALASLAAFAFARSVLRPALVGQRPPIGARDIPLRTRVAVATTGASFATAGTLLSVLVDFDTTPDPQLIQYLTAAAGLVGFSALIGWVVGDDAARGVEHVTRRMRELAAAPGSVPLEVPIVTADEVGDLTLAASELEQRIRHDEAAAASQAERERVARELHDGVAKSVSVLALEAASAASHAEGAERERLGRIEHLARLLADELRAIVRDVRGRSDPEPFAAAIERTVAGYPRARLVLDGDVERASPRVRFEGLRIVEEALRNVEGHAEASRVDVRVSQRDGFVELVVEDDGRGIGPFAWSALAATGHFGLVGMRERAENLRGDLRVERGATGTRVVAHLPLEAP